VSERCVAGGALSSLRGRAVPAMGLLVGRYGGVGAVAMRSRIVVCVLAGSVTLAVWLAGAATAGAADWSIQATPNPVGARESGLSAVSCTSATACTAVGDSFFNRGGSNFAAAPLAERWDGASWSIQAVPDPTSASQIGESGFSGVSCTSATACTAGGFQDNSNAVGAALGMTLGEQWDGVGWAIQPTPNPAGASQIRTSGFSDVSCTSATACTAVGSYGGPGPDLPLAERWDGVSWSIQTVPPPTESTDTKLDAVSCTSTTACTAVGLSGGIGANLPLAERWDGVSWSIQTTPKPTGAKDTALLAVSCTSATACTAVGAFLGSGGAYLPLAERWNGVDWSIQTTPNHTSGPGALEGVSCTSTTACTAVGLSGGSGPNSPLAERWNGVGWSIQTTTKPASATDSGLISVSCTSTTACTAVGYLSGRDGTGRTLAERWNGGSRETRTAILGGTAFVSPSGVAGVFLGCFAARPCRGSMTVKNGNSVLAHRITYMVTAADGGIVHLTLSRSARRSLAQGPVAVTIEITDAGGAMARASFLLVPFGNVATARLAAVMPSRIEIFGHTGFVSPSGTAEVFLGCFGNQNCTGTITLTEGHTTIASRHGTLVAADDGALIHIPINAHGRNLFAHSTVRVKVTIRDTHGPTASRTLTLEHFQ
jgi:hypothetical protein